MMIKKFNYIKYYNLLNFYYNIFSIFFIKKKESKDILNNNIA